MLLPALQRARAAAIQTSCLNNLKQLGLAFVFYQQEYDDYIPPKYYGTGSDNFLWAQHLLNRSLSGRYKILKPSEGDAIWRCPAEPDAATVQNLPGTPAENVDAVSVSYGVNWYTKAATAGFSKSTQMRPPATNRIFLVESYHGECNIWLSTATPPNVNYRLPALRHDTFANVLYFAGNAGRRQSLMLKDADFKLWP